MVDSLLRVLEQWIHKLVKLHKFIRSLGIFVVTYDQTKWCENAMLTTLNRFADNEGKSVQLSYGDRLRVVALSQQVIHGPLHQAKVAPLGAFDVIGKDRR